MIRAPVVQGEGHCNVFQCPYHSWTYALDGELVATPGRPRPMDDVENFDKEQYRLVSFRDEEWADVYRQMFPEGPHNTKLVTTWCYPQSTIERKDFEELTSPLYPPADEWDLEDIWVSELAQQGYRSRFCKQGRYSPREELAHRIALYVIDRVVGT